MNRGTCNSCKKVRKLFVENKYWHYCSECINLSKEERRVKWVEARKTPKSPRFAYPCIGGPLDGLYATTDDFSRGRKGSEYFPEREDGMYLHLANEYLSYNGAYGGTKKIGSFPPSMIFVHKSLLKPLASPKER